MSSSPLPDNSGLADVSEDSDEEMDWEEIAVPPAEAIPNQDSLQGDNNRRVEGPAASLDDNDEPGAGNIEITLKKVPRVDLKRKKQAEQNAELRALRLTCHKIHTVCLLANAIIRNRWLNDPVLHARLLSLTPMSLQSSFSMITKKRHPDPAKRGRLFETAVMRLTQWWYEEFFEVGGRGHIRSRTFDEVQKVLFETDFDDNDEEIIRSSKSLMKHALKRRGSRDISSQLFTALCRALGIPTRLVVSLQSVPWQAQVGKPKSSGKKPSRKGKESADINSDFELVENTDAGPDDDMEEVSIPDLRDEASGEASDIYQEESQVLSSADSSNQRRLGKPMPKSVVKLRKSKPSGQKLGSGPRSRQTTPAPPIGGYPPVFWTEVFSRPDGRWLPVDPTRYIVNKRKVFEPPPHDRDNRMVYVVAVEEDGYCRDVTPRYARDYGTKTSKAQLGGKGRREWWESVMNLVTRPYRLVRDDVEDEEFEYNKFTEGMPTSVAGFKNHPLYVLEQHLKREEVIMPKTEIGKFRGEPVYPRSNVVRLKTAENWMRMGRRVKEGVQPLKWVKQRAMTIHRRRAVELAQQEGDEMLQGLYSEEQTEMYVPDPVVNGVVPKNEFGNIDLYTPSMLPKGAVHIPYKGVAKVARKLGFDFAEAVTNFEFKKGRAFPVISGIVVACENEEVLLEAYWEAEREAEKREQAKRKERVIKRWIRLINGLRIRQRLQEQYSGGGDFSTPTLRHENGETATEAEQPGGFLTEADAVVQPFHLPRFEHNEFRPSFGVGTSVERDENSDKITTRENADLVANIQPPGHPNLGANPSEEDEDDGDLEEISPISDDQLITSADGLHPKSMRELAESAKRDVDATTFNGGFARTPVAASSATSGQSDNNLIHPSAKQISEASVTRPRLRGRTKRKGRKSGLSGGSSNENEDIDGTTSANERESGEIAMNSRQKRTPSSRSNPKRKRPEMAPPPSDRVLRTRVPKSAVQIAAEKEAETTYRVATEE